MAEFDVEERKTYTFYDDEGRVASVILNWDGTTTVDVSNPLLIAPHGQELSPSNLRFNFEYDAEGRQTAIVKPKGQRLEKVYDADGRLLYDLGPENTVGAGEVETGPGAGRRQTKWFHYTSEGRVDWEKHGTIASAHADPATAAPANALTVADIDSADITVFQKIAYQYDPKWGGVARKSLYRVSGGVDTFEREEVYLCDKTRGSSFGRTSLPIQVRSSCRGRVLRSTLSTARNAKSTKRLSVFSALLKVLLDREPLRCRRLRFMQMPCSWG